MRDLKPAAKMALEVISQRGEDPAVQTALAWVKETLTVLPGDDGRAFIRPERDIRVWLQSLTPEPDRVLAGMAAVVHREMFVQQFIGIEAYAFHLIKIAGHFGGGRSTVTRTTAKGRIAQRTRVPPRGAAVRVGRGWLQYAGGFLLSVAKQTDHELKVALTAAPAVLAPMADLASLDVPN